MEPNPYVRTDVDGPVANVTLTRPEKLNALTDELMLALTTTLHEMDSRDDVRVVVLTGEGRSFSAGYDISPREVPRTTYQEWREHFAIGTRAMRTLWGLSQPVIAKVHGPCLGGGFDLTFSCDLVVASSASTFGEPEVKFGGGSMYLTLPWLVGMRHVKEILLTGETLDAQRAYELGLVNRVVEPSELDEAVQNLASHMCRIPHGTLPKNKVMINRIYELMQLMEATRISESAAAISLATKDGEAAEFDRLAQQEGLSAALEWQRQRFAQEAPQ